MAKVPPPKQSRKGAPPSMAKTAGNLNKSESSSLQTLNLRVPSEFKRELKVYAAQHERSMTDLLIEAFGVLRETRG
jgi:hypothetical protein